MWMVLCKFKLNEGNIESIEKYAKSLLNKISLYPEAVVAPFKSQGHFPSFLTTNKSRGLKTEHVEILDS